MDFAAMQRADHFAPKCRRGDGQSSRRLVEKVRLYRFPRSGLVQQVLSVEAFGGSERTAPRQAPGENGGRGKAMTIDLKPEHQRTIELAIECGAYQNQD